MLSNVAPHTARQFARALVMPNLTPPIRSGAEAVRYGKAVKAAAKTESFTPLLTIALTDKTSPRMITDARELGVIAAKLYPRGATTNSEEGVSNIQGLWPVYAAMEECGMVLSLHAEEPRAFCLDREKLFIPHITSFVRDLPRLRLVVEHVTTAEMVDLVCELPDTVAATITAHHLELTLDHVIGDKVSPHAFCKPIAKRPKDRERLGWAAMYGGPKFFFGSDSAPHDRRNKECASGCAGIFSAPVAMQFLVTWFELQGDLAPLEPFVSESGARFYDLPLNQGEATLIRQPWQVPAMCGDVVPFCAGQLMDWDLI